MITKDLLLMSGKSFAEGKSFAIMAHQAAHKSGGHHMSRWLSGARRLTAALSQLSDAFPQLSPRVLATARSLPMAAPAPLAVISV